MSVQLAQIANWIILGVPVLVIAFLVGRDAQRKGLSRGAVSGWTAASILFFPVAPIIYLLVRKG